MFIKESLKQFLKPKRNKILVLIIFTVFILIYFFFFVVKCDYGSMSGRHCYIRSRFDGRFCDKGTDCGKGVCILVDRNRTVGKGVCKDYEAFGCNFYIGENGIDGIPGKWSQCGTLCID